MTDPDEALARLMADAGADSRDEPEADEPAEPILPKTPEAVEFRRARRRVLAVLDDIELDVLHDRFILGMSWPMIARRLEVPAAYVEQISALAAAKLRGLGLPGPSRWPGLHQDE